MTKSMFKKIEKLKSLIGYNNDVQNNEEVKAEKKEASIDTVKETMNRMCDCCNEQEVIIETSEMFKIDEEGNKIPLFAHPKVNIENGGVYDEVTICDNCMSACETEIHKQYVWFAGKMNSIYKEVLEKQANINSNNEIIEEIRLKAEEEIRQIVDQSNILSAEINSLQNTIELYAQEQAQLENQL